MTIQTISININLDGLRSELQKSLQEVICLVSAGLEVKIGIEPDELALPTIVKSSFGKLGWSKDQFHKQYHEWVLSNGFRDAIECASLFLESAHRILSIWELIGKQKTGTPISGEEWNRIFLDGGNNFHRLGLPDKLRHIAESHNIQFNALYKEQVLSINVARNCYVHRHGVVSDRDIDDNGVLKVRWSRLRTFLQNEDGEQDLIIGKVIEKESTLCIKQEENEKSFSLTQQLSFSVEEVSEIFWCFYLFGNDLVMNISKFGENHGFIQQA